MWHSVFHTVSAFCNAGFSEFTTLLEAFQGNLPLLMAVMGLIVPGGLGFLTLEGLNLWRIKRTLEDRFRLSVYSQIVLGTTILLIVRGWVAFTTFERHNTLAGMMVAERLVNGLFASIIPRTAGFNTIDYAQVETETNFLTIVFMIIGGSPGSTAGGIKTTTFALLGLLAWSRLQGKPTTSISGRLLAIVLMFIGRLGTLTFVAAMALRDPGVETVYVEVISDDHAGIMRPLGVTETVFPERDSGVNLASRISEGEGKYVRMGRTLSVQELVVPEEWRGHTLRELDVRAAYDVSVVGIHETTVDEMIVPPDPDDTLRRTDTLILAGTDEAIKKVTELASATVNEEE